MSAAKVIVPNGGKNDNYDDGAGQALVVLVILLKQVVDGSTFSPAVRDDFGFLNHRWS